MTNFDFLLKDKQFDSFSNVAIAAEEMLNIDFESSIINCRRAMEFGIKWMYSIDEYLVRPYQDNLVSLINTEEFKDLIDKDLYKRLDFIRKCGNRAAHSHKKVSKDEGKLCLKNLFYFMDYIAYCYADEYVEYNYNEELIKNEQKEDVRKIENLELDLKTLIEENQHLKKELTNRRLENKETYISQPLELSEFETRKIYIDAMLRDAGWIEGKNWINEVELFGMPNESGFGYADYVLYDDTHTPLAIIEAKRTCIGVEKGRQQAKLYADILEKKYHRRPIIFLSNGFETRIIDNKYPERIISFVYSKRDLEKMFNLHSMASNLKNINVNKDIAGRYYQEGAVKSVCTSFDEKNKRKALLVMATGSGKTRTVIALCEVLLKHGWIKNILFLADRNSLVTQAKRSFVNLLPELSVTNLVEDKDNYNARCVFSTYQTMINCIDDIKDEEENKLFTSGHFDLIICDEAHRSIYNKYKDIFTYFDSLLVGLTATPKDEIDKNTYEIFELENGVPTYGYELSQAVIDGYLVDFLSVESKFKFLEQGIIYDDLSDEDKAIYEDTFKNEDGVIPESIESSALNSWIFNDDTIKKALGILMEDGIKVDYGQKIGKTIIFAKNHKHAEKIYEIFNKEYPHLNGYAKVIDNYIKYAQSLIDEFSEPNKLPQIAISVDMLDTGIDVPEVVNLVFFKKVMSKAKFWQMIGRGTRLCPKLIDGEDKDKFYIFDFCGNFEFFRINKGKASANMLALHSSIFSLKFQIVFKLQDIKYQQDDLIQYRENLISQMVEQVKNINRDSFAAKQHLKYIDYYSIEENYNGIEYEDTLIVKEEVAPYVYPHKDDPSAVRFDALLYGLELAYLAEKKYTRAKKDLIKKVEAVSQVANIPDIKMQTELINKILNTKYVENASINDLEIIRENLRNLMKYIPENKRFIYHTIFDEKILSVDWRDSELENDDLKNYKEKAEFYIRQHQNDELAISKLKSNEPLNLDDLEKLEEILWFKIGTKEEYLATIGNKPLGEFVREIVGLDMNVAKEAFSLYLDEHSLNERQIYFINQIIEYIIRNGVMKDFSVLQESPFTDRGSISEVFYDLDVWKKIKTVIDNINENAIL